MMTQMKSKKRAVQTNVAEKTVDGQLRNSKAVSMKVRPHRGSCMMLAMIFLVVFASLSVAITSFSTRNLALADNQQSTSDALAAAASGAEFGAGIIKTFAPIDSTGDVVTDAQADATWAAFVTHVRTCGYGGVVVGSSTRVNDSGGWADAIVVPQIDFNSNGAAFSLRFFQYDDDPDRIILESTGTDGKVSRKVCLDFDIAKDATILEYAIASRGRMIVTGDTTINGDICSTWYKENWHPPFELTAEVIVNGTLNTTMSSEELADYGNEMETLDENGNPVYDEDGNRVISPDDSVQGSVEGINYNIQEDLIPGLDADDYDTSAYKALCSDIPASSTTVKEYFPHLPGDYTRYKASWNTKFYRHVYENQTFTNMTLPKGRNALFKNCTFEGVLYIEADSNASSTSKCNNVRFDDCDFNGAIVTSVPKNNFIQWRQNCLYFTGGATFDNQYMEESTILAPNFNVNLGNTNSLESESSSTITGAIVGGIVDIRGNANVEGTIISMYDTYAHSNGYVTNIGFAEDGGGEGGDPGDVGTITITPPENKMLPGGIISDIIIVTDQGSYREVF